MLTKRDSSSSLNYLNRKKEFNRISRENIYLFERLQTPKVDFKKSNLDVDYKEHKRQV